jgi:uncharacterized tellurite resistance protein B-like protein
MNIHRGDQFIEHLQRMGTPAARDMQILSMVILLKTAAVDGITDPIELQKAMTGMAKLTSLSEQEIGEVTEIAMYISNHRRHYQEIVAQLNDRLDTSQKIELLALVWAVIGADGQALKSECAFAREIRMQFNLTITQAVYATTIAYERYISPSQPRVVLSQDDEG